MPRLGEQLHDYVNAAFSGLWIQTQEPDEAEREILAHGRMHRWTVAVWDIARGLRVPGAGETAAPDSASGDPLAALRSIAALAEPSGTTLLVLHNFHRFLNNPEILQTAFAALVTGKERRVFLLVLSPAVQIPLELEKLFVVLEHALPDREQLEQIATELTSEDAGESPRSEALARVLDAAAGLTRYEAEGAFALSIARHNAIRPETIWEVKHQLLRKSGLLTLHRGQERFRDLGGLENLKGFCQRALAPGKAVKPRGVLTALPGASAR